MLSDAPCSAPVLLRPHGPNARALVPLRALALLVAYSVHELHLFVWRPRRVDVASMSYADANMMVDAVERPSSYQFDER